jgi:hypothetical protein
VSGQLREFDGLALYAALDEKRQNEGLSWPSVAAAVWELSATLHRAREARGRPDHPLAAETIRKLGQRGNTTCQHALFYLRWLERSPESFLAGATPDAGAPLPPCGPDRRPRWDLKQLHTELAAARVDRDLTWAAAATELRCMPSQLTGLKTARFATGMRLAMRITQWLEQPAAHFIHAARW